MYQYDSRLIKKGDIFLCLPGGESHIDHAKANGASAVLPITRKEMATLAHTYYSHPSQSLKVVGVTGTNGKTTVTYLVHTVLTQAGFNSCLQGTLTHSLTTPESLDIAKSMAQHLNAGGTHYIMEASSHGIHQHRIDHIQFDVKLLTNITQDHLDYHHTLENYASVKHGFMSPNPPCISIYPDDYDSIDLGFTPHLPGRFNLKNLKSAKAILLALGLSEATIITHLSVAPAPPGRFEPILAGQPYTVIIDFAHTPDALQNCLIEAKLLAKQSNGRLITLFGCGGNRDRGKRSQMAKVSQELSDITIITADNPRSESIDQIMQDIQSGFSDKTAYLTIPDRETAIIHAIAHARPTDVIVIAGKGHETYQIIGTTSHPFSDRDIATKAILNTQKER